MPLFMCVKCGCIDNTAVSNYWANKSAGKPLKCAECDPGIGQWHGVFPKRSAVGMLIDSMGYLRSKAEAGKLPPGVKIIGEVSAS